MTHNFNGRWSAFPTISVLAIVCGTILTLSVSAIPAEAQTLELRRGVAVSENGATARTRAFVSNGGGAGAARRVGFSGDGQGNGIARRGGCVAGQSASGCRGGAASWNSDGSFSGQSGAGFIGDNGVFRGSRALERDADGNLTGTRSTDASGQRGAFSGDSSLNEGTYTYDAAYSGNDGQSANVNGNWAFGSGGSRAVTCVDSTGAVVDCR